MVTATSAIYTLSLHDALPILAGFGSASLPLTEAVLVMVPAVAGAVALMVIVALAPEARLEEDTSELQSLTKLVCRLLLEKTKVTSLGRVSVTVTPVAGDGLLF